MDIIKKKLNDQRQEFLLTFFDKPYHYEYKMVNGFCLVCQVNNAVKPPKWQVAIYPEANFSRRQEYLKKGLPGVGNPDTPESPMEIGSSL